MMKKQLYFIKMLTLGLGIFFINTSNAALLEDARQECLAILRTLKSFEEDNLLWAQSNKDRFAVFSDQDVISFMHAENIESMFTKSTQEMRDHLNTFVTKAISTANANIETKIRHIHHLENLTEEKVEDHLKLSLRSVKGALEHRRSHACVSTLPLEMEKLIPINKKLAEEAILRRNNEALYLKIIAQSISSERINAVFRPFDSDPDYGGHFIVLHAYVMGLIESPPLPDQSSYRFTKKMVDMVEKSPQPGLVLRMLDETTRKAFETSKQDLETDDYKDLKRLEITAQKLLLDHEKKEIAINVAVDLTLDSIIEELTNQAKIDTKKSQKNAKKKARQKAAARLRKQAESSTRAFSPDLSPEEEPEEIGPEVQAFPSFLEEESNTASAMSTTLLDQKEILPGNDPILGRTLSQHSQDGAVADVADYVYEPFVKPAAAALQQEEEVVVVPPLKPRIYDLWSHFWNPDPRVGPWMEWNDFVKLFTNEALGFGINPIGGSIRQILYPTSLKSRTGKKHFVVHEPHGDRTTIGPATLRDIRENLGRDLGWSETSFRAE